MQIGNRVIGEGNPVFIICEGGVTNYGDINVAKRQIDSAVDAEADAIKFQAWKTSELVSKWSSEKMRVAQGFDWFKRMSEKEMSFEGIEILFHYAKRKKIEVFATPQDNTALDFLISSVGSAAPDAHRTDVLGC